MSTIPYKIAVLVYAYNSQKQLLLLRRLKAPNQGLYSPIGGKLEQAVGESPYHCALREIEEEIEVKLSLADIRLLGMVSETGYLGGPDKATAAHWLMFCFEVVKPLDFPGREMNEGTLEWVNPEDVAQLKIPKTDREVIWPLVHEFSYVRNPEAGEKRGIFSVHIDCTDADHYVVTHEHATGNI